MNDSQAQRGSGRQGGRGNRYTAPAPKDSKEAVPILKYGPNNNWVEFEKKMSLAA